MEDKEVIKGLTALAQPLRLQVFRALVVVGDRGLTPGAIHEALGVPPATLSFHLKELVNSGLVTQERASRNLIYRAHYDHMNALLAYLTKNCCLGTGCVIGSGPGSYISDPCKAPMLDNTFNVLFVCTGNSARSILAEGLMNSITNHRFKAYSAGSQPTGVVNPLALQTLASLHLPNEGFRSKSWGEFAAPGTPIMDFVFTVCDSAAGEVCPIWPGQPMTAHWGVPDPAAVQGSEEAKLQAFRDVAITLKRRIELLLALPIPKLERLAIQHEIQQIGTR